MTEYLEALGTLMKSLVLPVVGFAAGFLTQWFLQSQKARDELLKELTPQRAKALEALWKLTTPFTRTEGAPPSPDRAIADASFRKWYFDEAGALFLSWGATKRYFAAVDCLRDPKSDLEEVKERFSLLRTALKRDFGVYSWWSSRRQLPIPRSPLKTANPAAAAGAVTTAAAEPPGR